MTFSYIWYIHPFKSVSLLFCWWTPFSFLQPWGEKRCPRSKMCSGTFPWWEWQWWYTNYLWATTLKIMKSRHMEPCKHPNVKLGSEAQPGKVGIAPTQMGVYLHQVWRHWGRSVASKHISACEYYQFGIFLYVKQHLWYLNPKANLATLCRTGFDWVVLAAWTKESQCHTNARRKMRIPGQSWSLGVTVVNDVPSKF